jgi:hypothetical protein
VVSRTLGYLVNNQDQMKYDEYRKKGLPIVSSLVESMVKQIGRRLVLTETGRVVYRYADEIFSLGRELQDTLKGRPPGRSLRLMVGVANTLPKEIAYRLLACSPPRTRPFAGRLSSGLTREGFVRR